jgi:hypothetical protein
MTVEELFHSVSPGIFMQGPGGLLAVPLCEGYGRFVSLFSLPSPFEALLSSP